ncbi:MAG: alpha/beta hydrolase [Verrucomicrobiota bacterium]
MATLHATPKDPIELWPNQIPSEEGQEIGEETAEDKNNDGIVRISNVSVPTIQLYPAPKNSNTGAAVIVAPGGGYNILASKHEGSDVCEWLNGIGVNAILLKYRVPRRQNLEKHHAPMQDAQRAVSIVRSKAEEWAIDPERIGFLGFSAGGHLTAVTVTSDGTRSYPTDNYDKVSPVPNFGILVYPAYLKSESDPNTISAEITIGDNTPPCFVVVAHGDKRFVEGSALYYLAMQRADRECELMIYGKGGHGFGMKEIPQRVSEWNEQAAAWMKEMGFLEDE